MSYLGLNTTTDDHAAKASPADVRRKNRQLIFRLLFPTNQYSRAELGRRTGLSAWPFPMWSVGCWRKDCCARPVRHPAVAKANEAHC